MKLSPAVQAALTATQESAHIVRGILWEEGLGEVVAEAVSKHSLKTRADKDSQRHAVKRLRALCPGAGFFGEEDSEHAGEPDILKAVHLFTTTGTIFIEDVFDGTAQGAHRRAGWTSVVNVMKDGEHLGAAVIAPEWNGGTEVVGELGRGAWCREHGSSIYKPALVSDVANPAKAFVLFGIDTPKRCGFLPFFNAVAKAVETADVAGSSGLGVAEVVTGKVQALVEPLQHVWDWATTVLIRAAGGKVVFYRYPVNDEKDGEPAGPLEVVETLDAASYGRHKTMAFIAGAPAIVDWLFDQLQQNWPK